MSDAMTVKPVPDLSAGRSGPKDQQIRFCHGPDGVRLAYAIHGSGPPLIVVSCWLSHLQYDWHSPVWRHFLDQLGRFATVVRYDERGFGLSDWSVEDFSLAARLGDLEAIVAATGLARFAMLGMSGGSAVAMAYAIAHPERLSRLILYGTVCGEPVTFSPEEWPEEETYRSMIRVGWAKEDPAFRRVFTTTFIPDATEEQMRWLDELQRVAVSAGNAYAARHERNKANATHLLERVSVPTLVLHSRDDRMNAFDEARLLASSIPGARLVPLESSNHILLADEPAWAVFRYEVASFLEPDQVRTSRPGRGGSLQGLTGRELEVLTLAADGLDNEAIARALTLSVRTVERHMQNIYAKLDIHGRSPRTTAVARLLTRA
jgi:pimeloyl-ACP methyl ester carboxylesterase/DNA-binding CsgD family transcriptional regulator